MILLKKTLDIYDTNSKIKKGRGGKKNEADEYIR